MSSNKKAHSAEDIIRKLRQAEVLLHEGKTISRKSALVLNPSTKADHLDRICKISHKAATSFIFWVRSFYVLASYEEASILYFNSFIGSNLFSWGIMHDTMFDLVFPIILGIISFSFLIIGATVLLKKKPLLIPSKWLFVLMILCFLPSIINSLSMGHSKEFEMIQILFPLFYVILLAFMWIQMQGYIVMGVTDKSFRDSLFAALKEQNLEWKEELSLIRIPSENLDINVSIQSWMGTGQLKNKTKQNKDAFERVAASLKKQFSTGNVAMNNTTSIFYIIMGIIMLMLVGMITNLAAN